MAANQGGHYWLAFGVGGILGMVFGVASAKRIQRMYRKILVATANEYVRLKWTNMGDRISSSAGGAKDKLQKHASSVGNLITHRKRERKERAG